MKKEKACRRKEWPSNSDTSGRDGKGSSRKEGRPSLEGREQLARTPAGEKKTSDTRKKKKSCPQKSLFLEKPRNAQAGGRKSGRGPGGREET